MNFQFYVEKLKSLDKYKDFIGKNKTAYPCSCFFVIDKKGKDNQQHIDFFSNGKLFSFKLENKEIVENDLYVGYNFLEIDLNLDLDFEEVERKIEDEMIKKGIKNEIQKFLFSLQKNEKGHFIIGTIFISNLGMIKVLYGVEDKKVVSFEKKSFFDIVKIKGKGD